MIEVCSLINDAKLFFLDINYFNLHTSEIHLLQTKTITKQILINKCALKHVDKVVFLTLKYENEKKITLEKILKKLIEMSL